MRQILLWTALALVAGCGSFEDCCKRCTKGKACGDTCIEKSQTCYEPKGCACDD